MATGSPAQVVPTNSIEETRVEPKPEQEKMADAPSAVGKHTSVWKTKEPARLGEGEVSLRSSEPHEAKWKALTSTWTKEADAR